jgi:hypothetical protein
MKKKKKIISLIFFKFNLLAHSFIIFLVLPQILIQENYSSTLYDFGTLYICSIGTIAGSCLTHIFVESPLFGRKYTIVLFCLLQMISVILIEMLGNIA